MKSIIVRSKQCCSVRGIIIIRMGAVALLYTGRGGAEPGRITPPHPIPEWVIVL